MSTAAPARAAGHFQKSTRPIGGATVGFSLPLVEGECRHGAASAELSYLDERLAELLAKGGDLENVKALVDFEMFRARRWISWFRFAAAARAV
jgi:hypothetical protein